MTEKPEDLIAEALAIIESLKDQQAMPDDAINERIDLLRQAVREQERLTGDKIAEMTDNTLVAWRSDIAEYVRRLEAEVRSLRKKT